MFFLLKLFAYSELKYIFAVRKGGAIAQLVEQWTENPCVPGSIPGGTTHKIPVALIINVIGFFVYVFSPPFPRQVKNSLF